MPEQTASEITVSTKKEALQQLFRVLVGQPNHAIELFNEPILVGLEDLATLHSQILNKLKHYDVSADEFSATVVLHDTRYEEFGNWDSLAGKDWRIPEQTTSITLKWRFLVQFRGETKPSSHGVTVRLANQPRPFEVMQAMFSKDPDELERFEIEPAPMTCRVDFVDHLLSQELLSIVSNWHGCCRKPEPVMPLIEKIQRHAIELGNTIQTSVLVFAVLVSGAYFYRWSAPFATPTPMPGVVFRSMVLLLAGIGLFLYFARGVGRWLAGRVQHYLGRFGRFHIFELTSGDSNRHTTLNAKSRNAFIKFVAAAAAALLWNVVGGLFTAWLIG